MDLIKGRVGMIRIFFNFFSRENQFHEIFQKFQRARVFFSLKIERSRGAVVLFKPMQ
jgi:hypothetical protein